MRFKNAQEVFEYYIKEIQRRGISIQDTKAMLNQGFYIDKPLDNEIKTEFRKWNKNYADKEFEWYLSKNRSVEEIKKSAKIWDKMHNGDNIVNSNYGWQWSRNNQLGYVINELKRDNQTRRALLTMYDGKEHADYTYDTPCTLNIGFTIIENKLCMTVTMRSNDLWFGFCNDQYCFSKIQEKVAKELILPVGWYYHFACNLHLYDKQIKLLK